MNQQKFENIYEKFFGDIFRLSYSYVLNEGEAEDITQKTFYKMYIKWRKLPEKDLEIKKWLFRIAINESKDYLKSKRKSELLLDTNDSNYKYEFVENDILDALNKVHKEYRIPLYLYYYEGYNIKEIASLLKTGESTIKMRLFRGKDNLKKIMEGKK